MRPRARVCSGITPAERLAALARLRESIALTTEAADAWTTEVRAERDAWNPPPEP